MRASLGILRKLLRDPSAAVGLLIIVLLVAIAILAPLLATHPDAVWNINPRHRLQPPSRESTFLRHRPHGGRHLPAVFCSVRASRSPIAIVAVGAALLIGVPIGLVSGWRSNWLGETLMRVSDIFSPCRRSCSPLPSRKR